MKIYVSLACLLALPFLLIAQQDFEHTFYYPYSNTSFLAVQQGELVAVNTYPVSCHFSFHQHVTEYHDLNGMRQRSNFVGAGMGEFPVNDLIIDKDNNILATGYYGNTAITLPEHGNYIIKNDTTGYLELFRLVFPGTPRTRYLPLLSLPNGNYVMGIQNRLYWINNQGDSLKNSSYNVSYIRKLKLVNDTTFLALTDKGALFLNLDGEQLHHIPNNHEWLDVTLHGNIIWLLDSIQLTAYEATTQQLIQQIDISPLQNPLGLTVDGEAPVVWNQSNIIKYNGNAWSTIWQTPGEQTTITTLLIKNNRYYIGGKTTWDEEKTLYSGFIKAFKINNLSPTRHADLSIDNTPMKITTLKRDSLFDYTGRFLYVQLSATLEFSLTNRGSTPINNFMLYSEEVEEGSSYCSEYRHYNLIQNTALLPGETRKYHTIWASPEGFFQLFINKPRCFYIYPEKALDYDISNNTLCMSITTDVSEAHSLDTKLSIFPNPASDFIHIQSGNNIIIQSLQLYNIAGQLQNVNTDIHFNQAILHRGALPAGLYWLQIQTDKGLVTKKVILQ